MSTRGIAGRVYLERGKPVTVLVQWGPATGDPAAAALVLKVGQPARLGPRNVMIRRADGTVTVRPFRGLRVLPGDQATKAVAFS